MRIVPIVFNWMEVEVINPDSGEARRTWAMVPQRRFDNVAKMQYSPEHDYPMVPSETRSTNSHRHYWAALKDAYDNLPHDVSRLPSGAPITKNPETGEQRHGWVNSDHLRQWTLIQIGRCQRDEFEFCSAKTAHSFAIYHARKVAREHVYCRYVVNGRKLAILEAESQSYASMDKATFEQSKRDVLDYTASLIGITAGDLKKNAGKAA